jgi:polyisoprenoid-binding protein YceI
MVREVAGLPWPLPENGEETFQLVGDMTLHGVTRPLTWDVTAQFGPDDMTGQARTAFTSDDFEMNKPSLFFIVSVEDQIRLEMDFNASIAS